MISGFNKKKIEKLKNEMRNRTFIGEYIGNVKCQHLVKYPEETIVFYAIVDNLSSKMCQLPETSLRTF